ncbi:hypothetical protein [Pseudomonas paraveronii]|uniref:hypothetical protein n=1 Tax=Pseudomonas paraveronii TaxID=3040598 RepID=UPI002AAF489B|nr:hypothetical protein [Pseudomonas sp. V3/K/3/5]
MLSDEVALLASPGWYHKRLIEDANALHRANFVGSYDLSDFLELADWALAYAAEALLARIRYGSGDLMHMLITPIRCKGIALSFQERGHYQVIRGDVRVAAEVSADLGRNANVASVWSGLPLEPSPLPPLLDATLAGMTPSGFVLSGIE